MQKTFLSFIVTILVISCTYKGNLSDETSHIFIMLTNDSLQQQQNCK